MEYVAEIEIETEEPLTEAVLSAVAEIGGAAGGDIGGDRLDTCFGVEADNVAKAAEEALRAINAVAPARLAAVRIMTTAEHDRQLASPGSQLVGVTETAELLGVTRQRLAVLRRRPEFPAPLAELAAGPIWRAGDLSRFAAGWQRKPGRPAAG